MKGIVFDKKGKNILFDAVSTESMKLVEEVLQLDIDKNLYCLFLTNHRDKILLNEAAIDRDLENNWAVVAEAIQTILRREGFKNPG